MHIKFDIINPPGLIKMGPEWLIEGLFIKEQNAKLENAILYMEGIVCKNIIIMVHILRTLI